MAAKLEPAGGPEEAEEGEGCAGKLAAPGQGRGKASVPFQ